jgi:hypothetical protein
MNNVGKYVLYGLLALLLGLVALKKPIMQGKVLPAIRPMLMFMAPPKDLHVPVLKTPIDISNTGLVADVVFTNRYAGRHTLGLMAEKFSRELGVMPPQVELDVRFSNDQGELLAATTKELVFMFWTPNGNGVALLAFDTPMSAPVGKPVRCQVSVRSPDPGFQERNGPLHLYVQKDSVM